jgi:hypothetical protein
VLEYFSNNPGEYPLALIVTDTQSGTTRVEVPLTIVAVPEGPSVSLRSPVAGAEP